MTVCCAYCDRRVFMHVGGEPRCDWHVVPERLPLRVLSFARDRRYSAIQKQSSGAPAAPLRTRGAPRERAARSRREARTSRSKEVA